MHRAAFVIALLWAATTFAGEAIVVRHIEIIGLHRTRRWVVERELRFHEGDTITVKDLWAARDRLSNLSIFNSVTIQYSRDGNITVRAPELWPLWPVLSVSVTEGHVTDVFSKPKDFFQHSTISLGGTYINALGTAATVYGITDFGATQGVEAEYRTRWLSTRLPLAARFGFANIRSSNNAAVSYDSIRYLQNNSGTVDVATREGAPSRVGLKVKYWELHVESVLPGGIFIEDLKRYHTWWFTPYVILDRRNLEWNPSHGAYSEMRFDFVAGNVRFVRSYYDLRGYFPFTSSLRPPLLALRISAGTATNSTPKWAHYYYPFSNALRGLSNLRSESTNYVIGNAEVRWPLGEESTYDVPLIGRYGKNWPWGMTAALFVERGELSLAGRRGEPLGYGGGVYFRIPYFEILDTSITLRPSGHTAFHVSTGVAF